MQERGHIAAGQQLLAKSVSCTSGAPTGVSRVARAKIYPPAEPGWQLALSESFYTNRTQLNSYWQPVASACLAQVHEGKGRSTLVVRTACFLQLQILKRHEYMTAHVLQQSA